MEAGTPTSSLVSILPKGEVFVSIFDVWLESWTTTDLIVFGTASLVIIAVVFVRAILASRRSAEEPTGASSENGS